MSRYRKQIRLVVIAALTAAYLALVVCFGRSLPSQSLYLPIGYLVLVLSGLWWGRRGILMAGLLACLGLIPFSLGPATPDPWGDAARVVSFFVVALGLLAVRGQASKAYRAQRISEEKYRDITEKSLAGILVYRDNKVLYGNTRFKEFTGFSPEEIVGKPFWDFIYEADREKVRERLVERAASGHSDLRYESRLVAKDGHLVWADIVSSVVDYERKPAVLVSVYDITDQKENEEKRLELSILARRQEEQLVHSTRLAEMGEMAAGIAHELNQPLTGIKNYAKNASYMIEAGTGNIEEVKDNLRLIAGQVDRASKIINQMREMARRSERQWALVDINGKLQETVEFVTPQLVLSGVETSFSLAESLPPVMGDGVRLEQVFLNLLTNARQAMEDTEDRRLEIRTRHDPGSPCPVVVEIADTGKGFPPAVAPKLFAPFFSTKQARQGTGLGLSISLSIVKDHGGTIEAVGTEGKGATFTVRLPAGNANLPIGSLRDANREAGDFREIT